MSAKSWLLVKHAVSWYFQSCWESVKPGLNSREKAFDVLCFPDFPGLKSDRGFRAEFKIETVRDIPLEKFRMSVKPLKAYEKLKGVVELVDKQLEMMKAAEPVPDVVLIVLPKPVEDGCATIGASFMRKRTPLSLRENDAVLAEGIGSPKATTICWTSTLRNRRKSSPKHSGTFTMLSKLTR